MRRLRLVAPQSHFERYEIIGLRQAAGAIPVEIDAGAGPEGPGGIHRHDAPHAEPGQHGFDLNPVTKVDGVARAAGALVQLDSPFTNPGGEHAAGIILKHGGQRLVESTPTVFGGDSYFVMAN